VRFVVFTAMEIHVEVFWVMTPCSDVVGYKRFGGLCWFQLQGEMNWWWKQEGPPKHWYPTITIHGVTTQKTSTWVTPYLNKHHTIKTYWGSGSIAPHIPDLGTRWKWVVSFTTRPLYPQGKSPRYPLDRRLGGPQSRSGRGGEKKNSQSPSGIEP
jgi:hypothetical protein